MGLRHVITMIWNGLTSWLVTWTILEWQGCLASPGIRVLLPQFLPAPERVTYARGETARLYCSIRHLGELTVVWRKVSEKNPLTIGHTTWIDDPRIYVDRSRNHLQWDLIIEGLTSRDAGKYECQISMKNRMLRQVIKLSVKGVHTGQMKRNPEIVIMGSQFVTSGEAVSLLCNASVLGNPRRSLAWHKDSMKLYNTERISITNSRLIHNGETLSSHLQIYPARTEDTGLYTCRSNDQRLMTSAQVQVLTAGSNNVKRAGSSSQERGAVLSMHCCPNSHVIFILLLALLPLIT